MNKVKEKYLEIWKAYYGKKTETKDVFGRKIKKSEYKKNNNNGWNLDHICPGNKEGSNESINLQPLHHTSNLEKSDLLKGSSNKIKFSIIKNKLDKSYKSDKFVGIMRLANNINAYENQKEITAKLKKIGAE